MTPAMAPIRGAPDVLGCDIDCMGGQVALTLKPGAPSGTLTMRVGGQTVAAKVGSSDLAALAAASRIGSALLGAADGS